MKQISVILITIIFISCSESPEQEKLRLEKEYKTSLNNFKSDSLTILKEKFNYLLSFKDEFKKVDSVQPPKLHKEFSITMQNIYPKTEFNTIYVHQSFFDQKYNHEYPISGYELLYNIQRLLDDEEIELYELGEITKTPKTLNKFKQNCNHFVNCKYVAIQGGISVKMPEFKGDETFSQGYYKGLFNLYSFKDKTLIDNFIFEAQTDDNIETTNLTERKRAIMSNFFSIITTKIKDEVDARYTLTGEIPDQYLK